MRKMERAAVPNAGSEEEEEEEEESDQKLIYLFVVLCSFAEWLLYHDLT